MQKDSVPCSTYGHMMHNQAVTQESPIKAFQCSHCTLIFKSKVYLFEHLNKVHGFDVDTALKEAGLKHAGIKKVNPDDNTNSSGNVFLCQHCDFTGCHWDAFNEHEKRCQKKTENQNDIGNLSISENPDMKITLSSTNQQKEGAEAKEISSFLSVMSTSKTKCTPNSSKDLKTYKRPLQTITKYFTASSGSNGKPPVKLADSPMPPDSAKGTLILQESPSSSNPNSSGVFKVTAKSMIDISRNGPHQFLLNDQLLITDMKSPKPKEEFGETVHNNVGKRTNNESSEGPPAKKAKSCKEETKAPDNANTSKQQSSSSTEFSFEVSEDDEERVKLVNGDIESQKVYCCKHCDYSDVSIRRVSAHYQNDHPCVRYNAVYIQDPCDQSATFRCLECPVEFLSVPDLKRHYMKNHPEAPNVLMTQSREVSLVFKCFVCQFTTNVLNALKEHYKETHPTHKVDNSLLYCRYSATRAQEASSQLNTCEKAPSPERSKRNSPERTTTPLKEARNAPSPQHPTSRGTGVALYHCNNCNFSHKSVVVMHVHYQKSHPEEPVTIDKIKQSTLQMTPEKSPNSVTIIENCSTEKNASESSKNAKDKGEVSQKKIALSMMNPKHTPETSKTHLESPKPKKVESVEDRNKAKKSLTRYEKEMPTGMDSSPSRMFYCQFCSYSSTNIRSVVGHHNAKHTVHGATCVKDLLSYSAKVHKKKLQSEAKTSASTPRSDSKTSKQVDVYSKKELHHKEDDVVDVSVMGFNAYECAENLFYCQKCNFGNPSLKGVLNHQSKIHRRINSSSECILEHTALIREEIKKSKSLPLPLMSEGDENKFFCRFCNYRHSTLDQVMRHCLKRHRGFEVKAEQVRLYTSLVLERTQKLHLKTDGKGSNHATLGNKQKKKTKKLAKCFSVSMSTSMRASQTQRTLQCHRCTYVTQYVYLLRRHMWKIHRSNRSCNEVLRACFKQGNLQSGYHCDLCVFSHKNAATVYKHYKEQHPGRKLSLEYISTRLYVGPSSSPPKQEKPQIKHSDSVSDGDGSDGILPSQRSGENDTRMYSCRACSFKCSSMSSITHHYRVVHPWSVKEDGSVLGVINSKKRSANSQVKDPNEIPGSFDTYQIPLEFDKSPGSSHEATEPPRVFKCSYCSGRFHTQRNLRIHCGMKHQEAVTKKSDEQQEQQIQTRVHIFKCPHCTYINSNYQGVLTHCQMRHPALTSRADSLHVDKTCLKNVGDSGLGDSLKYRGYMCKTCQQVCATVEKLNKHYEREHKDAGRNIRLKILKPAPKPSTASKIQSNNYSTQGAVSKASFLHKKIYAVVKCHHCTYICSTKIALSRHMLVHHKNPSLSKVKDCVYKCVLCSRSYSKKKRLRSHYIKKHGKDAALKYFAPVYKQVPQKSTSSDCPLTQQPESTSQACKSSKMTDKNKILVYKCPSCPYVNASYHGTLTHCQMMHPDLVARADELQTDEIFVTNMVRCTMGKGSNERGYMCNKCPQIHASLAKLKLHCERDHDQGESAASEHSDEIETEGKPDHSSVGSVSEAVFLKNKTTVSTTEIDLSQQLGSLERCQSNALSVQNKESLYKCYMCNYTGSCRKYLYCHLKYTHKLDALSMYKMLEKYNKRKRKAHNLPKVESKESALVKCNKCPNVTFNSSQLLIAHYSTFHKSDCKLDFTVLSQRTQRSTGIYKCKHCKKQINGIRNLWCHLDRHRARNIKKTKAAEMQASLVITTTPEAKSSELCRQGELPLLETVEELAQWNVTPVETFTLPTSPLPSPSKPSDLEQPELESTDDKRSCKQCRRTFMSLKGLRSHERSHAALAAIKKLDSLPPSALKHNINEYVLYKSGTLRPFLCSICSYRTTVLGLWKSHFMKKHQDVIMDPGKTDNQDEESTQSADKKPPNLTEEMNILPEPDEEPEITEKSLYLEPPDVQRQLNQYSLMAQIGVSSKANLQETMLPENSLLHCEFCNFSTGHLSSMRRHYLNRHGKKILRCKDCDFFTGIRKTLEMHMESGHSTFQSEPTHQKDLRCPFCLYQTKNKNNMIDHIVLHREERVVPIEVRRPKLSRYLQGIVFRCHKCTFTSGSAENLRLHMMRHNDIKPYKCRLCYFDCTRLSDLEAHLSDKHQVLRNHELVGQVSLDQLEAGFGRMGEEEEKLLSNLERHNGDRGDIETEEFVTGCNEVLHETTDRNLTENDGEKTMLQMKEADQKHEQDPQEQAGQGIKDVEDFSGPEKERQKENQAQPEQRDTKDSSIKFTPPKEEAAEWSSTTYDEKAKKAQTHKLHVKALQHRTSNIEAVVEDDNLRHTLVLDEDSCIGNINRKADQDRTVKMEQNNEAEVVDNVLSEFQLLGEEGSSTLAHNSKNPVNMEAISSLEKNNHIQINNIRAQESLKVERKLPKWNLGVSFANYKEEVHNQKNSEELTDSYREMPVLENAFLKEEMYPLECCKEEEETDHLEQKQDREGEMITEDNKKQSRDQEQEEGARIKEADTPHEHRGLATGGAAEVLCPEKKPYTCEFCGRNLMNNYELTRHIMRHGI